MTVDGCHEGMQWEQTKGYNRGTLCWSSPASFLWTENPGVDGARRIQVCIV